MTTLSALSTGGVSKSHVVQSNTTSAASLVVPNIETASLANESFISVNNESWYSDFIKPVMNKLTHDETCKMVKLGPINIGKLTRYGFTYFYIGQPSA